MSPAILLAACVAVAVSGDGESLFVRVCLDCHRPGSESAVDLESADSRTRRALTAAKAVRDGLMPPWLPGPGSASLRAPRDLSDSDRLALAEWLEAGARVTRPLPPTSDATDGIACMRIAAVEGWSAGAAPEMQLRSFAVPLNNARPMRVRGVRLVCQSPGAVHSVSLLADTGGYATRLDASDPEAGYDAPGDIGLRASGSEGAASRLDPSWVLPPGFALEIPSQSTLVVEAHAEGRGKSESAACRVDLIAAVPGSTIVRAHSFSRLRPATIPECARAVAVMVRAAANAQTIEVVATSPDGARTLLLNIPRWNDRFSEPWVFDPPVPLDTGSLLSVEWTRDPEAPEIPPTSHAAAMSEPTVVVLAAP